MARVPRPHRAVVGDWSRCPLEVDAPIMAGSDASVLARIGQVSRDQQRY